MTSPVATTPPTVVLCPHCMRESLLVGAGRTWAFRCRACQSLVTPSTALLEPRARMRLCDHATLLLRAEGLPAVLSADTALLCRISEAAGLRGPEATLARRVIVNLTQTPGPLVPLLAASPAGPRRIFFLPETAPNLDRLPGSFEYDAYPVPLEALSAGEQRTVAWMAPVAFPGPLLVVPPATTLITALARELHPLPVEGFAKLRLGLDVGWLVPGPIGRDDRIELTLSAPLATPRRDAVVNVYDLSCGVPHTQHGHCSACAAKPETAWLCVACGRCASCGAAKCRFCAAASHAPTAVSTVTH